jgi:hypothetical protein
MNASDIVKAKQNKALYNAYYKPTVFQSTVYSTISIYSSVTSPITLLPVNSYVSCVAKAYTYVDNPTFTSYESMNAIKEGAIDCGAIPSSVVSFKNTEQRLIYSFSTIYSTIAGPIAPVPGSFYITSTTVSAPPSLPMVQSLLNYHQGTSCSALNPCPQCLAKL